jgi:amino acid adenylation domain-containing protein
MTSHITPTFPPSACIHDVFAARAAATPDASAVIHGEVKVTYAAVQCEARRLAASLRAGGVGPDVAVALICERSVEAVVGMLGILEAGGAYLPIDATHPPERIAHVVADSRVTMAVIDGSGREIAARHGLRSFDARRGRGAPTARVTDGWSRPGPHDVALIVYTSGSTRQPKGVQLPHSSILARFRHGYAVRPGDLQRASLSVVAHLSDFVLPLLLGAPVIIASEEERRTAAGLTALLETHGTTRMVFVPSQLAALLDGAPDTYRPLRQLDTVIVSGEPLTSSLVAAFRRALPRTTLVNSYGATEMAGLVCMGMVDDPDDITVGVPVPGSRVYIVDDALNPVPAGTTGDVCLAGEQIALGYLHSPDLTAATFVLDPRGGSSGDRMYRTGDLGVELPDGRLRILGRRDAVVKVRGHRVNLGELEDLLEQHTAVHRAGAVLWSTDDEQSLVVLAQLRAGTHASSEMLRTHLSERVPSFMIPTRIDVVPQIPVLPNGKLDRPRIALLVGRTAVAPSPPGSVPLRDPSSATSVIADIWREVLGVPFVDDDADFFRLGGDSLRAMRFVARARAHGLTIRLGQLTKTPRLRDLAAAVAR